MKSPDLPFHEESLLEHGSFLRALARELARDASAAEDLTQETWLAYLRARPDSSRPLRPWLAKVLRNTAGLRARRSANRAAREAETARQEALPGADALVERAEAQQLVARAVLALAEPYRSTLLLRYYEGLSPSAIARAQDVPAATVRTRLFRGLARLREVLDEKSGGDRRQWMSMLAPLLPEGRSVLLVSAGTWMAASAVLIAIGMTAFGVMRGGTPEEALHLTETRPANVDPMVAPPRDDGRTALATAGPRTGCVYQLVDAESGDPLAAYALRAGDEGLTTDENGEVELSTPVEELVLIDHEGLARDVTVAHRERARRPHPGLRVAASAAGARLEVRTGPTVELLLTSPVQLELDQLELRLESDGEEAEAWPVAPLRAPGAGHPNHWVRFGEALAAPLPWRLVVRDARGHLHGVASIEAELPTAPLALSLQRRGAVEGRVHGPYGGQPPASRVVVMEGERSLRMLAWCDADAEGRFHFRWLPPGQHTLHVLAEGCAPLEGSLEVSAGLTSAVELELARAEVAGDVRGVIHSESGALREQLLVFLRDDDQAVLGVAPPTWAENAAGELMAGFAFEDVPPGDLSLDVLSLDSGVTALVGPSRIAAPQHEVEVTVLDGGARADVDVEAFAAEDGAALESFELEVQIQGGPPRIYLGRVDQESGARSWTLIAGGMRWNTRVDAPVLPRVAMDASISWAVSREGRETQRGDEADLIEGPDGVRRLRLHLAKARETRPVHGNADEVGDL